MLIRKAPREDGGRNQIYRQRDANHCQQMNRNYGRVMEQILSQSSSSVSSVVSDSLRHYGLQYARLPSQEFREGIERTEKERDEVMADGGLRTHITFISYIYCLI